MRDDPQQETEARPRARAVLAPAVDELGQHPKGGDERLERLRARALEAEKLLE